MTDLYSISEQEYISSLLYKMRTISENQTFPRLPPTIIPDTCSLLLKSESPTRHVAVISSSPYDFLSKEDLLKDIMLNTSGEIRAVYSTASPSTVIIISYYSLIDASTCLSFIEKKCGLEYKPFYAKPCSMNKHMNERLFVVISCTTATGTLQWFDYMEFLTSIGAIHSISQASILPNCTLINLEYDDERSNKKLLHHYTRFLIEGVQVNVYMASNDHHLCQCSNNTSTVNNIFDEHTVAAARSSSYTNDYSYFCNPLFEKNTSPSSPFLSSPSSSTSFQMKEDVVSANSSLSSLTHDQNNSSTVYSSWKDAIINGRKKKTEPVQEVVRPDDNAVDIERIQKGQDTRTTFMIRNIPNKYTQKMLIDCINKTHANTYDFIYLRIDFKNKCNVGYAFINFIEPKFAVSFAKERVGKGWKHFNSDKKCSLSYANIQGKDALVKKFQNSTVMFEPRNFRPKLFHSSGPQKGKEQDFPKPDKTWSR